MRALALVVGSVALSLPIALFAEEYGPSAPRDRLVNRRFVAGNGIPRERLAELKPAWKVETGGNVSGMPLTDGGVVYAADWDGAVFAVNAQSGRTLWKKTIGAPIKS